MPDDAGSTHDAKSGSAREEQEYIGVELVADLPGPMSSVVHSSATSSAAFSGATDSPDTNARRPPAERGLVLSQRDKTHLIGGTFAAFALGLPTI